MIPFVDLAAQQERLRERIDSGIARVLAEAGATVVGTARTEADIVGTIGGIEAAGGKGLAVVADAMSRPDGERVVNTAVQRVLASGAASGAADDPPHAASKRSARLIATSGTRRAHPRRRRRDWRCRPSFPV